MEKQFKCPVCDSPLSESKYYEVIGAEEKRKELEETLKKQLNEAKKNKEKLIKEKKQIQEKLAKERIAIKKKFEEQFEKQKAGILKKAQEDAKKLAKKDLDKLAKEKLMLEKQILNEKRNNKKQLLEEKKKIKEKFEKQQEEALKKVKSALERKQKQDLVKTQKEFLAKGKEHEKRRTDRLTKMMEGKVKALDESKKKIKELQEQLKKGTTPQVEGLNLEEELVKLLKEKFPEDKIEHKSHGGDILHYIKHKTKEIGLIVYECKKTQKFQRDFVKQIKNDIAQRNATYGVLVTSASEKDKSGFWVDNDILIVHPYGTIYIAEVLRKWIINLYALKLDKDELNECARKLLEYVKSDKFKNCVQDNIHRARELNEILQKEMKAHMNSWKQRDKHYSKISENSKEVESDSLAILRNEKEILDDESQIKLILSEKAKKQ